MNLLIGQSVLPSHQLLSAHVEEVVEVKVEKVEEVKVEEVDDVEEVKAQSVQWVGFGLICGFKF